MAANGVMAHKPSFIQHKNQRFLIMDAPTDKNLPAYIEECKKHNVRTIVRACEPTYSTADLTKAGIEVLEMPFTDGDPPPDHVVKHWLAMCKDNFKNPEENRAVAVHCVAGLGRAPVLVAVSLIELGMDPFEAVPFIRKNRRGAINARQLKWLESYVPQSSSSGDCCTIL